MFSLCLNILLSVVAVVTTQDMEYDSPVSLTIYHALDGQHWYEAGKTNLHNLNPGKISVPVSAMNKEISQALLGKCKEDEFMHIKTVIQTAVSKELEFLSFAKSCAFLQSPALLNVNVDHAGSIVSTSLSPSVNMGSIDEIIKPSTLDVNYVFKHPEIGPMPDTATYINRLDKEREAKERGSTQDNRSFFAKYWMYIVPVVLFVLLSGSANADASSGR
uniref:ER membrane protein complex subunit 10 n=1 Tax=Lygus hesperus TaxID=30085 RepID=A0A0K8SWX9_LYGHE